MLPTIIYLSCIYFMPYMYDSKLNLKENKNLIIKQNGSVKIANDYLQLNKYHINN